MSITPGSLKRDLADGAAVAARAEASHGEIHKAAEARREVVNARLAELNRKSIMNAGAAKEYGDLVKERGRLDVVLGR